MNKKLLTHKFLGWIGIIAIVASFSCQPTQAAFKPVIHRHSIEQIAAAVNSYLIETEKGIIVIDSSLTVSGGKSVRAKLESLKKPLLAVVLTHGHPDHYNGVTEVLASDQVPVIATVGADKSIRENDAAIAERVSARFGDEWPKKRTFPSKTVKDGESVTFDGVTLTVHDLGPGESHSDAYWMMGEEEKYAFIGDVVINQSHAYMVDGHSALWLKTLDRLKTELKDVKVIYPGHGEPGSLEILDWQKSYVQAYRDAVKSLAQGQPILTPEATKELIAKMKAFFPSERGAYLIDWGANPVAAELAKEK